MDLSICLGLTVRLYPTCFTDKIAWDYTAKSARDKTLSRRMNVSVMAVSYAVQRGEKIAREFNFSL
jgi:hypothetical protein